MCCIQVCFVFKNVLCLTVLFSKNVLCSRVRCVQACVVITCVLCWHECCAQKRVAFECKFVFFRKAGRGPTAVFRQTWFLNITSSTFDQTLISMMITTLIFSMALPPFVTFATFPLITFFCIQCKCERQLERSKSDNYFEFSKLLQRLFLDDHFLLEGSVWKLCKCESFVALKCCKLFPQKW